MTKVWSQNDIFRRHGDQTSRKIELCVVDLLYILDISKAVGPDGIGPRIFKEGASILKYPLCKIFNISLRSGVFPSDWKKANVCPVFKKDSPTFVTKLSSDIDD